MNTDLPYIQTFTNRHGQRFWYFRRKGWAKVRLPSLDSPDFLDAYQAAKNAQRHRVMTRPAVTKGSFSAPCDDYERSRDFRKLGDLTRREMRYVIRALEKQHGTKPVKLLERRHVEQWLDDMQEKPGAANKMLRTLKQLMAFAIRRGYRSDNPASHIKLMKLKEWRPWTEEEIEKFAITWPISTLERTGFALALYTGQRRADLVSLTFAQIAGNAFRFRQAKTGTELEIPIHPELKKALPSIYPNDDTPILAKFGKGKRPRSPRPLNPIYFGHLMARAIHAAGLPKGVVLHGLRKSAAVALIEAGCSPHQAAAITGHGSTRMLEHYVKKRDQAKLGRDAMRKWVEK